MAIDERELADELTKVMEDGERLSASRMKLRPVDTLSQPIRSTPLTPTGVAKAVEAATDPDTDRSTRMMKEQTEKIIIMLENEIKEAEEVKSVIERRIVNLSRSLKAAHASLEILGQNSVPK